MTTTAELEREIFRDGQESLRNWTHQERVSHPHLPSLLRELNEWRKELSDHLDSGEPMDYRLFDFARASGPDEWHASDVAMRQLQKVVLRWLAVLGADAASGISRELVAA